MDFIFQTAGQSLPDIYDLVDLMPVFKIAIHYVVMSTFYAAICCIKDLALFGRTLISI
jgi:hypothetical protein